MVPLNVRIPMRAFTQQEIKQHFLPLKKEFKSYSIHFLYKGTNSTKLAIIVFISAPTLQQLMVCMGTRINK